MKFWKRIFIYSMTLFLILFNGAGIFIIENIHKRGIDRSIKAALDEHKSVEGILYLNADSSLDNYTSTNSTLKDWVNLIISSYVFNVQSEPSFVEIYDNNNSLIFSNSQLKLNTSRPEIINSKLKERSFIIRQVNDKRYLFITSKFKIQNTTLNLVLTKNINYLYTQRIENYQLFMILDIFITLLLALGMYFISKKVTTPIVHLSKTSKEVAQGDYTKRIYVKNRKDEISSLAKNFNIMIEAIEENIQKLTDLNASQQRFIDSLTHELKTPLTSIIGYSDLLIKGNINEEVKFKALSYINSEATRLEKLSLALLKLRLIQQEKLILNNVSINTCINTACKTLSYKIKESNINLKVNIQNCTVTGDSQLITILLINILDNAIKASNNSGIIEITDILNNEDTQYTLSIKDYGIGIPMNDLYKIKEPFYMVDKARDRAKNGAGLGLALCNEICSIHKINFDINSIVNEGTTVLLTFNKENIVL